MNSFLNLKVGELKIMVSDFLDQNLQEILEIDVTWGKELLGIIEDQTHILCWNMMEVIWLINQCLLRNKGTGLIIYVGTGKDHLADQDILLEKSEAIDWPSILGHAKVIWVIRTSLLRIQRHWTHSLCWNMQRTFNWSEHSFYKIRGTGLTCYVRTCKGSEHPLK
jgi:hypothetical protein